MKQPVLIAGAIAAVIVIVIAVGLSAVLQPGSWVRPQEAPGYTGLVPASKLLRVPVTGIYPGGTPTGLQVDMKNPLAGDPDAVVRGMRDFDTFNCSGCHMANAGGGMGPALSNAKWLYRDSAANIYLDIAQGRSAGMPAFGAMLPDRTIWELVAYIQSITEKTPATFGDTTSLEPASPGYEQVPAEKLDTTDPWGHTEPMPPGGMKPGSDPGDYRPASPSGGAWPADRPADQPPAEQADPVQ
jgi:cytochrome c oxidase cbb3-type subunit 3